jgi:choline dehydrogenase-like flavoprotein
LIEAGGDGRSIIVRAPAAMVAMVPGRPKINNYAYETEPQPGLNGRRGYQPRGRCLGGSSALNAMLYIRGQRQDYDDWVQQGATGWSFDDVLPYFKRSEGNERGAPSCMAATARCKWRNSAPRPITEDFVRAAMDRGYQRNHDFNGPIRRALAIIRSRNSTAARATASAARRRQPICIR